MSITRSSHAPRGRSPLGWLLAASLAACRGRAAPSAGPSPAPAAEPPLVAVGSAPLAVTARQSGWELGRVSWAAADREGLIYLLQRGEKADAVVVVARDGRVVRSWGRGMYGVAHSIRVDPQGNVWTTDANTSIVRKFSPEGKELLTIDLGPTPAACGERRWRTCGTTDVAFAPNGHVYVADGYWNARVVELTAEGRRVREWGTKGAGRGELDTPHSIVVDERGVVYVADRGNDRVQRFTLEGRWLGEWRTPGSPFSLALVGGTLWMGVGRRTPAGALQPTLVKADARTGRVSGYAVVAGGHGLGALPSGGELLIDVGSTVHVVPVGTGWPR